MTQPAHDFVWSHAPGASIGVLTPVSPAGEDWADKHLPQDAIAWGGGVVVEPRYIDPILEAITQEGMKWVRG